MKRKFSLHGNIDDISSLFDASLTFNKHKKAGYMRPMPTCVNETFFKYQKTNEKHIVHNIDSIGQFDDFCIFCAIKASTNIAVYSFIIFNILIETLEFLFGKLLLVVSLNLF